MTNLTGHSHIGNISLAGTTSPLSASFTKVTFSQAPLEIYSVQYAPVHIYVAIIWPKRRFLNVLATSLQHLLQAGIFPLSKHE